MSINGQLTFEDMLSNPSVTSADEMRLSAQAWDIYKLLWKFKEVSNVQMSEIAMQYNARIYEIRQALAEAGSNRELRLVRRCDGGLNYYSLVLRDNR